MLYGEFQAIGSALVDFGFSEEHITFKENADEVPIEQAVSEMLVFDNGHWVSLTSEVADKLVELCKGRTGEYDFVF